MKKLRLIIILLLAIHGVAASQSCNQYAENYYGCGVPSSEFEFYKSVSKTGTVQQKSNWCWAACIQTVLNYHGLYVGQEDIVSRIYGSPNSNNTASASQMLEALSGWAPNMAGGFSRILASQAVFGVNDIINNLSGKWPLIVGLSSSNGGAGHAYVLTGIYFSYQYDSYGNTIGVNPIKVVLRDPWPNRPSKQEVSWNDFMYRCSMVIKIKVTR